jgi:hypothetical protein
MMSLRCLLHVRTSYVLIFTVIFLSPSSVGINFVLERIKAARVLSSPLDIVAFCPSLALGLVRWHELIRQVGDMWVHTWMILITEQPLDIVAVRKTVLRLLMRFGILRTHARKITLGIVGRAVWWLPPGVPRLRGLRLHRSTRLSLALINMCLILFHMLIIIFCDAVVLLLLWSTILWIVVLLRKSFITDVWIC